MQIALFALCVLVPSALAAGAGRAFPIDSENYVVEQFQYVNPQIEWDPTNYLVDMAGNYANCNSVGQRGAVRVEQRTPEGEDIGGVTDWIQGNEAHTNAVNSYIRTLIDTWMREGVHDARIRGADRFGCSVRPGCKGYVSVACLFSPDNSGAPPKPMIEPGKQYALAFTGQQYMEAEAITGNKWDRSHFLENLSGFETDCSMMTVSSWEFPYATEKGKEYGITVVGLYGVAENRGSTPVALAKILDGFKQIKNAKNVGCSVIPDCVSKNTMYVVLSCLYEE